MTRQPARATQTQRLAAADSGGLFHPSDCSCSFKSPIIIDTSGNGFQLTSIANGVFFSFGSGSPTKTAWTAQGSDDAFLVLDRDNDGIIDDSSELFGNFTPQPPSSTPNGFAALAVYDRPENGGNGDGLIDNRDAVFARLRLWIDSNHDGVSQTGELHTLPEMGITSISLDYSKQQRQDEYGNVFRYRAVVNGQPGSSQAGRWAYDVFFAAADRTSSANTSSSLPSCGSRTRQISWKQLKDSLSDIDIPEDLRKGRETHYGGVQ